MGSLQVEETSAYCTVSHRASASNYQLSNMKRPAQDSNRRPQRLEARTLIATPPSPQEATVIAIPKPGKDSKNPSNYHPISLTSCLCKTMEGMINTRLV